MTDPIQPAPPADDGNAAHVEIRVVRGILGRRRTVVELSNRTTPHVRPERFTLAQFKSLCETAAYRLPAVDGGYVVGRLRFTDAQWRAFRERIRAHVDSVTTITPVTA